MESNANSYQVGGDHYKTAYQHWDWSLDVEANPMQYQITKYLRARKKGGLEDMKKLKHFIQKYKEQRLAGRDYPPSRIKDHLRMAATSMWCKENSMDELETEIALTVIMSPSPEKLGNLMQTADRMMTRHTTSYDEYKKNVADSSVSDGG